MPRSGAGMVMSSTTGPFYHPDLIFTQAGTGHEAPAPNC
jgi:hypothetical protein